jgi:hypothetical protein
VGKFHQRSEVPPVGVMTCAEVAGRDELQLYGGDLCPRCGNELDWSLDDKRLLVCLGGCGWQCWDDPDV